MALDDIYMTPRRSPRPQTIKPNYNPYARSKKEDKTSCDASNNSRGIAKDSKNSNNDIVVDASSSAAMQWLLDFHQLASFRSNANPFQLFKNLDFMLHFCSIVRDVCGSSQNETFVTPATVSLVWDHINKLIEVKMGPDAMGGGDGILSSGDVSNEYVYRVLCALLRHAFSDKCADKVMYVERIKEMDQPDVKREVMKILKGGVGEEKNVSSSMRKGTSEKGRVCDRGEPTTVAELQRELKTSLEEKKKLEQELRECQSRVKAAMLSTEVDAGDKISRLLETNEELTSKTKQQALELEKLQGEVKILNEDKNELDDQLAVLNDVYTDLGLEKEKVRKLKEKIEKNDIFLTQVRQEKKSLEQQLCQQTSLAGFQGQKNAYMKRLSEVQGQKSKALSDLTDCQVELQAAKDENQILQSSIRSLQLGTTRQTNESSNYQSLLEEGGFNAYHDESGDGGENLLIDLNSLLADPLPAGSNSFDQFCRVCNDENGDGGDALQSELDSLRTEHDTLVQKYSDLQGRFDKCQFELSDALVRLSEFDAGESEKKNSLESPSASLKMTTHDSTTRDMLAFTANRDGNESSIPGLIDPESWVSKDAGTKDQIRKLANATPKSPEP